MKEKIKIFTFTTVLSGGENKKLFIFTPVFLGEKMKNFIFTLVLEKEGKYISSNDWFPGSFSYWYGNPVSCWEPTMHSSSETFHPMNTFYRIQVSPLLVASVISLLIGILITPRTNSKVRQATSHCLKYIFVPSPPPPPPQK